MFLKLRSTRIPSSVKFAVIPSLVLMRFQNFSINWGKVVALIVVHCRLQGMNVYGLAKRDKIWDRV